MPKIYEGNSNYIFTNDTHRHFAPDSETYTGADSLLTAQNEGWCLLNIVYQRQIRLNGGRFTTVYYFKLLRESEMMIMPILANPFIEGLLMRQKMLVRVFPGQVLLSNEAAVEAKEVTHQELGESTL